MAKVVPINAAPVKTNLAAVVAPKLDAARLRLVDLEARVGAAALTAALDPGAGRVLAELNGDLDRARRDVRELEAAHAVATERDARSLAAFEAHTRRTEFRQLRKIADERLEAMQQLCGALESAAKAYASFLSLTDNMAASFPTGMVAQTVAWHAVDSTISGQAFPAAIPNIVASEMFRHAPAGADGRRRYLPGAHPLTEGLRLLPDSIEPATEGVRRQNEYLLGLLRDKLDALENADAAPVAKSA